MSDLEKFVEMYRSFGIECVVKKKDGFSFIYLCVSDYPFEEKSTISNKLIGYSDFFSKIKFDKDGKFINQGFYE